MEDETLWGIGVVASAGTLWVGYGPIIGFIGACVVGIITFPALVLRWRR